MPTVSAKRCGECGTFAVRVSTAKTAQVDTRQKEHIAFANVHIAEGSVVVDFQNHIALDLVEKLLSRSATAPKIAQHTSVSLM
jgi:hypothetical protein